MKSAPQNCYDKHKMKLHKLHSTKTIDFYTASTETVLGIPLMEEGISAGFPSPAEDFIEGSIDLNQELIQHPSATFYGRVNGNSMKDLGIHHGDLLIIDKSLSPANGKVAVCYIDGEFTLKTIKIEKECCWLVPANDDYQPIKVTESNEFMVWGVVLHVIKSF